jgi:hypothetical protein
MVLWRKEMEETVTRRTAEVEQANISIKQANAYPQDINNSFKQPLQVLEPVFEQREIIDFRFKLPYHPS